MIKVKILWIDKNGGYARSFSFGDFILTKNEIKNKKVGDIIKIIF